MFEDDAARVLKSYPRVFLACHDQHVTDPATSKVLSANQVSILDHLDTVEPTGLADLARHMGVTASTMSISIERLVLGGYVERERHAEDGRRVELRLTQAGLRVRRAQSVLNPEKIKSLLGRLSAPERARAVRGLEMLARAADEEMASRAGSRREGKFKKELVT